MNTLVKRGLQLCALGTILSSTACVVDPYYSGSVYSGHEVYPIQTQTSVYSSNSNSSWSTGFLIGNSYFYDNAYYPVSYYTDNHRRYYRPDFSRPSHRHPEERYRHLNRDQIDHWRRNQSAHFAPDYRPNRPQTRPSQHNRPNDHVRPQQRPHQPNVNSANRPNLNQAQRNEIMRQQRERDRQRHEQIRRERPSNAFGPNLNRQQRQHIQQQRQQQQRANPVRYRSASEQMRAR